MRDLAGTVLRNDAPTVTPPVTIREPRPSMTFPISVTILAPRYSLFDKFSPLCLRFRGGKCSCFSSIHFIAENPISLTLALPGRVVFSGRTRCLPTTVVLTQVFP